ncbi:hypothetical protein CC1G_14991 [Coprinopsis cinerea okayama7|uniref:Uncharacterized protein n=1 Tax=Coprinopsis cinerea (strain Okayama-7 / 130 / ATCC MYA-4618 / FGSC 9003) TaxID=240176 RepID=D6RP15_COPC7|nr:hypothetical protein CC1G_14991 [Coprinopsis cinerea okayama7\|eukprot:XP_002910660.1 hypothetical protein CC1G_14991 [Coprinopsis cinerea okayama7\
MAREARDDGASSSRDGLLAQKTSADQWRVRTVTKLSCFNPAPGFGISGKKGNNALAEHGLLRVEVVEVTKCSVALVRWQKPSVIVRVRPVPSLCDHSMKHMACCGCEGRVVCPSADMSAFRGTLGNP